MVPGSVGWGGVALVAVPQRCCAACRVMPRRSGDVGPAVAVGAEAGDGALGGGADLVGECGHVGDGLDVAGGDAAAVGAQDAAEEGGVLVVLDDAPSPVERQGLC